MMETRQLTADGYELTFGTNHLGHFLLTTLLLDTLKRSAPSRIVNVSSRAHERTRSGLQRDNLQGERSYGLFAAYAQSKLANVLFARELTRRLQGTGVVANSIHPGVVRTEFLRGRPIGRWVMNAALALVMKSVEAGVQTQVAVAVDPDLERVSGKYFADCRVVREAKQAQSDEDAAWLWAESERLVEAAAKRA